MPPMIRWLAFGWHLLLNRDNSSAYNYVLACARCCMHVFQLRLKLFIRSRFEFIYTPVVICFLLYINFFLITQISKVDSFMYMDRVRPIFEIISMCIVSDVGQSI